MTPSKPKPVGRVLPLVVPSGRVVPTLSLSVEEACQALGVSHHFWSGHIAHEVDIVRVGRRKLVSVRALEAWLDEHGERLREDVA